jgi:hypothetical protein
MGTIDIEQGRILKGTDKKVFLVETLTDTDSACDPEQGCIWYNLRTAGGEKARYHLTVCALDWDEKWHERWLAAFAALPHYREQFLDNEDRRWLQHPTISTDLPHAGFVEIDELLAPAIRKLNTIGCRTVSSCQGVESKNGVPNLSVEAACAYILLDRAGEPLPPELLRAWEGAGLLTSAYTVHTSAPYGLDAAAAVHFVDSLRDWLAGTLDVTGERYRLKETRKSSLPAIPVLPQVVLEAKQAKAIKALIRLGGKARFRDFAELRSGTDKWSKLRLPALREALGEGFAPVAESGLDEEHQARMARWALRGLPSDMALRKVKTDMEIASNAR